MKKKIAAASVGVVLTCALGAATPAGAQSTEVKEKPPLYTYVGSFALPRTKWAELAKQNVAEQKIFEKALSSGQLIGYGTDAELVHTNDGYTHDSFWSSMSMARLLGVHVVRFCNDEGRLRAPCGILSVCRIRAGGGRPCSETARRLSRCPGWQWSYLTLQVRGSRVTDGCYSARHGYLG